jgi:hypothetical protein
MRLGIATVAILVATLVAPAEARAPQENPAGTQAAAVSGLHDFDFLLGNWTAHHRRLKARLVKSTEWVEFEGTLSTRPLMEGWGNSGDNLFVMPSGARRGVSLRAYDPKAGQWLVWWLDGSDPLGEVGPPIKGRFENGVGRFYSQTTQDGKPVLVRVTWTSPAPGSPRWEQALSADGGKTWEVNWITDFTRASPTGAAAVGLTPPGAVEPAGDLSGLHAFDLRVGHWITHHRRLEAQLAGSKDWKTFEGEQTWWAVIDGRGNVDDNVFRRADGDYYGATLRAYDPKTGQWGIWWLDGRDPTSNLDPPMKGHFLKRVGTFYADDTLRGKPIRVRFIWSNITASSAHWEQAFSADAGKTWETNWVTDFTKAD